MNRGYGPSPGSAHDKLCCIKFKLYCVVYTVELKVTEQQLVLLTVLGLYSWYYLGVLVLLSGGLGGGSGFEPTDMFDISITISYRLHVCPHRNWSLQVSDECSNSSWEVQLCDSAGSIHGRRKTGRGQSDCESRPTIFFIHNFAKCWPFFKILSPLDSERNLQ